MWRLGIVVVAVLATPLAAQQTRPNIIVILADDLGHGDVSCYNPQSKITTKHIDRLARQGMRFVDAHSPSSVCTPTRYGILTGRYCWRSSLTSSVLEGYDPPLIEANRVTLASLLRRLGYVTGCIGKWHLGLAWTGKNGAPLPAKGPRIPAKEVADVDFTKPFTGGPTERGFDYYFGISASLDMPPYCYLENDRTVGIPAAKFPGDGSLYMNLRAGAIVEGFRFEDVQPTLVKKAVEFIEKRASANRPFFLYVPLASPHVPIVPNKEFLGKSKAGKYGDFVLEVDAGLGAIMDALDRRKLADNTLLIMTSDNGSWWHYWEPQEADDLAFNKISPRGAEIKKFEHQGNAPWRGLKADIWEGGHRVPFIARWPARVRAGATSSQLVVLTDLLATCADIAGTKVPDGAGEDSFSLLPALMGKAEGQMVRRTAVHHSLNGQFAVREGKWVLSPQRGSGGFSPPGSVQPKPGEPSGQLFDLDVDPAQRRNLWKEQPDLVRRLNTLLTKIRRDGERAASP